MPSQASWSCQLAAWSSGLWDYFYICLSWWRGNWISLFPPFQAYNNYECCAWYVFPHVSYTGRNASQSGLSWEPWPKKWHQGISSLSHACWKTFQISLKNPICPSHRCRRVWSLPTKSEASACPLASCPSCSCYTGPATEVGTYTAHEPLAQPLWMERSWAWCWHLHWGCSRSMASGQCRHWVTLHDVWTGVRWCAGAS